MQKQVSMMPQNATRMTQLCMNSPQQCNQIPIFQISGSVKQKRRENCVSKAVLDCTLKKQSSHCHPDCTARGQTEPQKNESQC